MNASIDIIVTYLDSFRPKWKELYKKYQDAEIEKGLQPKRGQAAFGTARYRDWKIFKYWFRGVEQNCPWVNKVFVVLQDEDQVPEWLNLSCPKLRVVYHSEFMPKQFLPTFNGPALEMFYCNIPDLSENFIACDDDYFFINPVPEDWFFEDNIPMTSHKKNSFKDRNLTDIDSLPNWRRQMLNVHRIVSREMEKFGQNPNFEYHYSHLPEPRKKSFEKEYLKSHYFQILFSVAPSHFRYKTNLNSALYIDLMKVRGISKQKSVYHNSKYSVIKDVLKHPDLILGNYMMVCYNDVDFLSVTEKEMEDIRALFEQKFPNKCEFEK